MAIRRASSPRSAGAALPRPGYGSSHPPLGPTRRLTCRPPSARQCAYHTSPRVERASAIGDISGNLPRCGHHSSPAAQHQPFQLARTPATLTWSSRLNGQGVSRLCPPVQYAESALYATPPAAHDPHSRSPPFLQLCCAEPSVTSEAHVRYSIRARLSETMMRVPTTAAQSAASRSGAAATRRCPVMVWWRPSLLMTTAREKRPLTFPRLPQFAP